MSVAGYALVLPISRPAYETRWRSSGNDLRGQLTTVYINDRTRHINISVNRVKVILFNKVITEIFMVIHDCLDLSAMAKERLTLNKYVKRWIIKYFRT